jgi:RNA polymerase sigma factor (sigma-70 family)
VESPRDPLPADLSAEPEPADPPPAEAAQSAAQSAAGPEPAPAVPRPRHPGESTEPLRLGESAEALPLGESAEALPPGDAEALPLGESAEALPPGDADLIAASRAGDAAAYDTLYRRHLAAANGLARQLVRNRAEADDVVAETFVKILDLLHRGGGPDDAFRPYLLTAVRRAAYDRHRAERRQVVTDEMEAFDRGVPFADPAVADLERTMIARAFASLPERWQAVLWHTEIEGARPADVAPLLGLTANGVAALAYRAREGLRQAYLQMHLSGAVRDECRPVAAKLGAYVRGGLAKRDAEVVGAHLDQCAECRRVFAELGDVNVALKGIVAPIVLGPAAVAYLASVTGKGSAGAWIAGRLGWFRRAPKGQQAAAACVAAAAVVGLAAAALALTGHSGPAPAHRALPPAAAGAPAPATSTSPGPDSSASRHPGSGPSAPGHPGGGAPGSAPGAPGSAPAVPGSAPSGPAPAHPAHPAHLAPAHPTPASPARQPAPPPSSAAPVAPSRTSPASPSTAPAAVPTSGPAPQVQIAARINPVGTLSPGVTGIVGFAVDNTGSGPAAQVTANVTLPAGVSLLAGGTLGRASMDRANPGGWTCAPAASGATCTHGPLAADASTTSYLQVVVAADAPPGQPPAISVDGGGRRATARGTSGVSAGGFPARFAASGRYAVTTAGARLGGGHCDGAGWDGVGSDGAARDRTAWDLPPGPRCPPGRPGGTLALSGPVVWAGLYWAWTGGPAQAAIVLRAPGGPARQVTGVAATAPFDLGFRGLARIPVHQAFADVTGVVAQYGSGAWSATMPMAGPAPGPGPVGWPRGAQAAQLTGAGYLGWTLVVVTGDPAAPSGQVMVLDGAHAVDAAHPGFSVPLGGLLAGRVVRVHTVKWAGHGPRFSAFTQPLSTRPAVSFPAAGVPYLVGVIAAAAPLVICAPLTPSALVPATLETPALPVRHAWGIA